MEAKCESCGATYLIQEQVPREIKCVCNSRNLKIIK